MDGSTLGNTAQARPAGTGVGTAAQGRAVPADADWLSWHRKNQSKEAARQAALKTPSLAVRTLMFYTKRLLRRQISTNLLRLSKTPKNEQVLKYR